MVPVLLAIYSALGSTGMAAIQGGIVTLAVSALKRSAPDAWDEYGPLIKMGIVALTAAILAVPHGLALGFGGLVLLKSVLAAFVGALGFRQVIKMGKRVKDGSALESASLRSRIP